MSDKQFDFLIYIGRMEPPTHAHIANIKTALNLAEKVIILFGSSFQPRTIKNPWSWTERAVMVSNQLPAVNHPQLIFQGLHDHRYSDTSWAQEVQAIVKRVTRGKHNPKIGILGCKKDHTSYYLDFFPQWEFVETSIIADVNASDVRDLYFSGRLFQWRDKDLIDGKLQLYLQNWAQTPEYTQLVDEWNTIEKYKAAWEIAPYAPTFVTTDAVVIQSGHILLIQRKASPGRGLWALPGGFVNQHERLFDGCIRELHEETRLKVPDPVLKGSVKGKEVFDFPSRSLRGRTITHAWAFELRSGELAPVKGSDDAAKAQWFPIDDVLEMEEHIFEDHGDIIKWALTVCGTNTTY